MCQEALQDLKIAIRAAGEHKQRITIHVTIEGLRLRDEKTGVRFSFIKKKNANSSFIFFVCFAHFHSRNRCIIIPCIKYRSLPKT
jgi:hypothetical protein